MHKNETPQTRIHLNPSPWNERHCLSCGRDPRIIYDTNNQYVVGWEEKYSIDRKGQLCLSCALSRVAWERR